jgi:hypothetical protein
MNTLNPNITPTALSPVPIAIPAGYEFAGQPADIDPSFLTTLLTSICGCYSQLNGLLIQENEPNTFLYTVEYFLSLPNGAPIPTGTGAVDADGHPAGSLYVLVLQNGAAVYVPPAPPVVNLKTVFGLAQNNGQPIQFGDGSLHLVWTAGNGTTHKVGDPAFPAGVGDPDSSFMNPNGPLPPFGTYMVIQWGMGQAIAST